MPAGIAHSLASDFGFCSPIIPVAVRSTVLTQRNPERFHQPADVCRLAFRTPKRLDVIVLLGNPASHETLQFVVVVCTRARADSLFKETSEFVVVVSTVALASTRRDYRAHWVVNSWLARCCYPRPNRQKPRGTRNALSACFTNVRSPLEDCRIAVLSPWLGYRLPVNDKTQPVQGWVLRRLASGMWKRSDALDEALSIITKVIIFFYIPFGFGCLIPNNASHLYAAPSVGQGDLGK